MTKLSSMKQKAMRLIKTPIYILAFMGEFLELNQMKSTRKMTRLL
jgi:hypothetical protein